jgi:Leucine-rich repeat (LRR) protein
VVFGVEAVEITSRFNVLQILNLSRTSIKSLPESIVRLVNLKTLILSYCHQFRTLSPKVGELKQLEVLDLEGTGIRDLSENLRCPMLLKLFLHNNYQLKNIPPLFFNYMPALQILNLSKTSISSLPKSIVNLASLKRLILSWCHDFRELSPEVRELKQLEVLDLEGTEIRHLPENPRGPVPLKLLLHNNNELRKIPPPFFSYMTALQILNLSRSSIWSLPESIVKLVSLKRLILSYCHNFIELSPEVGELKQLEVLDLEGTEILDLPENLRCPVLLKLFLHNNNELGKIPPSFFSYMPALQILNLSRTGIWSLPKSIVKLVSLKRLILSYCHDFTELSPEVGELKQLEVLDLEGTEIRDLPENLRCPMLLELFLHNNNELGKIPPSFFNYMPALQILNLSRTGIWSLPESFVKLVSLKRLILSYCHDFIELSPEVGELKQLEVLNLEGTEIRDLPENLRCPMLLELFLHNNNELRNIPPSFFRYMPALQILNLSRTGIKSLPKSFVKLYSLKRLILSYCHDFMELSPEVGELKQLEVLDLEGTGIRDLPENLRCPMLLELFLHNNSELRKIPPSFFRHMPALQILNLSRTGIKSLPKSIVKLFNLKRLILSYCHDFMELSPEVGELKQLEILDLEGTKIRDLPENLRCPMLLELFLHNNNELRKIPPLFFSYMPILEILNLSMTGISSLPESIVKLASLKRLILSCCHDFIELSPEVGELKQLEVFDLEGTEIMDLPKNPRWLMLLALFLQRNEKLRTIPSSFFDYMTALQTLNLSRTGIRSLPESVVRLVSLKRLFLSYCHRFMRLSPKVGELKQLEVLDLEGTNIMDLPKEIMKLTNLTCLKFSIYGFMGNGSSAMQSDAPVPRNVISTLSHLEEVNINVNPDDKQWNEMVKDIIVTEVCTLANLNTLHFYFPRVDLVENFILNSPMWKHPSRSHFRFTVGHHVKRIMPRLPREAELELEKWERCLKYINGVAVPKEIKKVLQYSTAFFLERHASVKKLSDFGIGNMEQLKCCVVGECNEVEVIMDEADADDHEEDVLGSLEYLCIYYMKNLRSIWKGPVETTCLSLLKYLTLRTCPQLTTIFTKGLLDNLCNLEDLTVDDCPSIKTIVSCETSAEHETSDFLPNLKSMSLHYVPELISISSGLHIAPRLEWLSFYNCPNLKHLLIEEVSSKDLKKIKGEWNWWVALKWRSGRPSYLDEIFVPIDL